MDPLEVTCSDAKQIFECEALDMEVTGERRGINIAGIEAPMDRIATVKMSALLYIYCNSSALIKGLKT